MKIKINFCREIDQPDRRKPRYNNKPQKKTQINLTRHRKNADRYREMQMQTERARKRQSSDKTLVEWDQSQIQQPAASTMQGVSE